MPFNYVGNIVAVVKPFRLMNNSKNSNKRLVMNLIRLAPAGISRAELARRVGLSRAALSLIVSDILEGGLVRESATGPTTGGRRPILIEVNPGRGYVIGIDMGVTHLGLVIADFAARILSETEIPFDISQGPITCLKIVEDQVRDLLAQAGLESSDILAIGMGVPGPIVAEAGMVSAPPIMPGWHNFPIRNHLEKLWGCPISLNNDAELGALGEWAYGAGRGDQHLAYIKVGSGVGAGLLLDGRIYGGATGCAGEIGHITIQNGGPICSCGNSGCLEALAGGHAIARKAREAVRMGKRTQLASIHPTEKITARDVTDAARLGDLVSQQILSEAGVYLGIAVASLVNLINPNVVVVGGGVAHMGDLLLEPIRQIVRERSLQSAAQSVRISAAVLGRRLSSMGAVAQAINTAVSLFTE
jgi:glucokinase-like ROK family protein